MPKAIEAQIECPFYIKEGKGFITCEGIIKGTVDMHCFKSDNEKAMFEVNVCGSDCGRKCVHYKRVNDLYESGLR